MNNKFTKKFKSSANIKKEIYSKLGRFAKKINKTSKNLRQKPESNKFEDFKQRDIPSKVKFLHKRVKSMQSEVPLSYTRTTVNNFKESGINFRNSLKTNADRVAKEISPIYPTAKKLDYTYAKNFWDTPVRSKRQVGSLTTRLTKSIINNADPSLEEFNIDRSKIEKLVEKFILTEKRNSAFRDIFCDEEIFRNLFSKKNWGKLVEELLMFTLHSSKGPVRNIVVGSGGSGQ